MYLKYEAEMENKLHEKLNVKYERRHLLNMK